MTVRLAWLVDANAVSEMMRPRPDPMVAAFLDSIADEGLGIASVTIWEILNGIGRLDPGRRRRELAERVPGPSRRPVRGSGHRVVCSGCGGLCADHGGQTPAR